MADLPLYKISEGNDYALLAAVGGECAGALAVLEAPEDAEISGEYEPLSDEDIAKSLASGGALSSVAGEDGVRLSLAGAQDKLPVYLDASEDIFLPKAWGDFASGVTALLAAVAVHHRWTAATALVALFSLVASAT